MSEHFIRGMTAPDLMCVCIDERGAAGSSGRLYHRYGKEPGLFQNEYQLLTLMEELMDRIGYPQASVEMRSYGKKNPETGRGENPPAVSAEEVAGQQGRCATFLVHVQYRQNATWQGEIFWAERQRLQTFRSARELLKLFDSAR